MIKIENYEIRYVNLYAQADQSGAAPEEQLPLLRKIIQVTFAIIYSVGETIMMTASQLSNSFQRRVLGFNGLKYSISFSLVSLAYKTAMWAIGTGAFFIVTASRQLSKNLGFQQTNNNLLKLYASKDINLQHLTAQTTSIDVSNVPDTLRVDDLLTIFDEINFNLPDSPGYMPPSTRTEGTTVYDVAELRTALNTFVTNVNGRIPFIGTPPSYDTLKLESFYKQIEDASRFSIHKLKTALLEFREANGTNVEAYSAEIKKQYIGLLEDQSRLAIDLGIAGKHCGARYMGDVMDTYFLIKGDEVSNQSDGLRGTLCSFLSNKRKEIAIRHIATHLAWAENGVVDTHSYAAYMQSVGKVVGIPGTEHVSESLSSLNPAEHIKRFFQEYTVDFIISTVEEELKKEKNLSLRTAFADTVVDNLSETANIIYKEEIQELEDKIREALASAAPQDAAIDKLLRNKDNFQSLIEHCRQVESPTNLDELLQNKQWDDLFDEQSVIDWFNQTYPGKAATVARVTARRELAANCKTFSNIFEADNTVSREEIALNLTETAQITAVHKLFPGTDIDFISRLIKKKDFSSDVRDFIQRTRKLDFKTRLLATLNSQVNYSAQTREQLAAAEGENLESVAHLSSDVMAKLIEWVLVSQGIFTPQNLQPQFLFQAGTEQHPLNPNIMSRIIDYSEQDKDLIEAIIDMRNSQEVIENLSEGLLKEVQSGKRYTLDNVNSYRERVLNAIFERAFRNDAQAVLNTTESSVPLWKEITLIIIPKTIASVLDNSLVKLALTVVFFYQIFTLSYLVYEEMPGIVAQALETLSPMFTVLPTAVLEAGQRIIETLGWVQENPFTTLFYAFICQRILIFVGQMIGLSQPYQGYIENFSIWNLIPGLDAGPCGEGCNLVWEHTLTVWNACESSAAFFQNIADKVEAEDRRIRKEKAYADWSQAISNFHPAV